ncbi:MAG TPA: dihydrodipicolinate synthase family protein [Candidatus Paceibacterota bacterium]|nr:dihydrodipicolinate synthase family protein [Candidatus Paceibacterota bacterium]
MSSQGSITPTALGKGLWGVLATPFDEANLKVDEESMIRQLDLYRAVGATGVVTLGVFGEAAQLDFSEQADLVRLVSEQAPDLPLVIGLSERETDQAIAVALRLLDAATQPPAGFMCQINSTDPQALMAHFEAIHAATGVGIVVQDYPLISGVKISSQQILDALEHNTYAVAIKSEAPPTSLAISSLTSKTSVPVFGGLGGVGLLDELMSGASGAMTGFSHPEGLAETLSAWKRGGFEAARDAFASWLPLANFEAQVGIGLAIRKEILKQRGVFTSGVVRPPAMPMPGALRHHLSQHISALIDKRVI